MATSNNEHSTGNADITQKIIIAAMALAVLLGFWYIATQKKSDSNKSTESSKQAENKDEKAEAAKALAAEDAAAKARAAAAAGQAVATVETKTDKAYRYVVGDGESVTTLARRAVAGIDGRLSPAERVAAETKLVADSNGEQLAAGQDYTLATESVKAAVDWAKGLSAADKAAWQPWADQIAW